MSSRWRFAAAFALGMSWAATACSPAPERSASPPGRDAPPTASVVSSPPAVSVVSPPPNTAATAASASASRAPEPPRRGGPSADAGAPGASEEDRELLLLAGDDVVITGSGVVVTRDRPESQRRVWLLGLTATLADFARLPPPFRVGRGTGEASALFWNKSRLLDLRTGARGRIEQIDAVHPSVRGEWHVARGLTAAELARARAYAVTYAGFRGETLGPWPCAREQEALVCRSPEAPALAYLFPAEAAVAAAEVDALGAAAPELRLATLRWTPPVLDPKTLANVAAVQRVAARQIFRPAPPGTKITVPLQGSIVEYVGAAAHTNQVGGVTAIRPTPCRKVASHSCVLIVGEACPALRDNCEGMYLRVAVDMSTAPPSLDVAYSNFATVVATQAEVEAELAMAP
jgi:hypothetical protein